MPAGARVCSAVRGAAGRWPARTGVGAGRGAVVTPLTSEGSQVRNLLRPPESAGQRWSSAASWTVSKIV